MYGYTTPTLPIRIKDLDFSLIRFFRVKIVGKNAEYLFVIEADSEKVDAENRTIYVDLTQEQTAELEASVAMIQVRYKYLTGKVDATNKKNVTVEDVLDKEII